LASGIEGQGGRSTLLLDPYRNFLGSWSGKVSDTAVKVPSTVRVVVSEEKNGRGMRWDYEFGVKGEKGHQHDTKWFVLKPPEERMLTHWKGKQEIILGTSGLDAFAQTGFGHFYAGIVDDGSDSKVYERVTFDLHPDTLSYLWETGPDPQSLKTFSHFEFNRDV
jgi:hypothetical protein